MGQLHYKGYTGCVEYDEENNYFYGHVLGLHRDGISYEGTTADELKKDFQDGIEDYLAHCKENGKKPGKWEETGEILQRENRCQDVFSFTRKGCRHSTGTRNQPE